MFSRNHPHRQPFNARNSRFSDRAIDLSLQYKQFGDNHSPVLWNSMYDNLDNWPETAHMMALLGIHPATWLVRITLPDYVDLKNMRISGHSHTVAKIEAPEPPRFSWRVFYL